MLSQTLTSIENFAWELKYRSNVTRAIESGFLFLINVISFAGNLLLGIAVIKNPNLRRTVPNMYIITLAVSDFLSSLMGIPFSVASLITGKWPFNNFICQLQGLWILLLCAVSLQTLAVTALNRYFRVVRSRVLYQKIFNMKTTTCGSWLSLRLFRMSLQGTTFSSTLEKSFAHMMWNRCMKVTEFTWFSFI